VDGKRSNSGGMAPLMICVCMALTACGGGSSSQAGNANLDTGSQTDITQSNLSPLIDGGEDTSQITPQITPQSTPQSAPQLAAAVPDLDEYLK